ncbi:MAG: hypothetical protein ABFS41_12075 [Myxococcota bacterium]
MTHESARIRIGITGTIAALFAATLAAASCASGPPEPPRPPAPPEWDDASRGAAGALEAVLAAQPPAPRTELVVRLAFSGAADLDLYVSDPLDETVYYANTPVRSGGVLDADLRCEDPAPRVETVRFAAPLAGRYRVGVDFQHRCPDGSDVVPWAISIDAHGERRMLRGLAEWNVFASRVDEFAY